MRIIIGKNLEKGNPRLPAKPVSNLRPRFQSLPALTLMPINMNFFNDCQTAWLAIANTNDLVKLLGFLFM
ncbi:MAG: hypothetical protein V7K19_13180 [Nostoc sp.]